MAYFSYHAKVKKLISGGHLVSAKFYERYKNISPALVLFFDNERPMPIREHRFEQYRQILSELGVEIEGEKE